MQREAPSDKMCSTKIGDAAEPILTNCWCCRHIVWAPAWCGGLVLWALYNGPGWTGREGPFEVEVRDVEQDITPYVGQLVLANVPVERWIIDPYEHSLLNGPCNGMTPYPPWGTWTIWYDDLEVLAWSKMGEGPLRCSFSLSPKLIADYTMYS